MLRREKKKRERKRLLDAGKRFCVRHCNYGNVGTRQNGGDTNNNTNNHHSNGGGDLLSGSLGPGSGKRGSIASITQPRGDVEDLVRSRLSLMSLTHHRRDSRTSLPGYTSMSELKVNSISLQLPSPHILRRPSLTLLGEVDEHEYIDDDDEDNDSGETTVTEQITKSRSTSHLEREDSTCSMGGGSIGGRLSLVRRFSFRKNKGSSSAKSPYKMAKLTIQKRSSSTPFESSFFVKPKPERRLSSLLPRRKSNKGSDSTFSMDSILQRALMPPGLDEATRMIFNSSNSSSKQRRNAVFEMNNEERNGLKVFLREHIKSKQPKE